MPAWHRVGFNKLSETVFLEEPDHVNGINVKKCLRNCEKNNSIGGHTHPCWPAVHLAGFLSPPPSSRPGYLLLTLQVWTSMWFPPRALHTVPIQMLDYSSALLGWPRAEVPMGLPVNSTQQKMPKTQGSHHCAH